MRPPAPHCSLVTNSILNLGVRIAFQNVVEQLHFKKRTEYDALTCTTEDACGELNLINLTNVWNWWQLVLDLIIEEEGGNRKMR